MIFWKKNDEGYKNPITTLDHIKKLQEILVQVCINYINENKLTDIDMISFNADGLQSSAYNGEWCSSTDSYINVEGLQENEKGLIVRKNIGKWH